MAFVMEWINKATSLFDGEEGEEDEEKREEEYTKQLHRNGSFAPVRHGASVKWYVDGHDYCWAVAEAIANAQHSIFIEDWWLSPELYLRRPPAKYPEYRLDTLLKRKAEEGVKVYVIVYKEVKLALSLNSKHTQTTLEGLHPNIVVQRSPQFSLIGLTAFWSHHDKYVVVDNRIAFLGGLDLCYGRWDTRSHRLADFTADDPSHEIFPGQDYNNARVRDFADVHEWGLRLIDKSVIPRMPWHDIALCTMGGTVLDVSRHFCERWNYVKTKSNMDEEKIPFLRPPVGGFGHHQKFSIPGQDDGSPAHRHLHFRHGTRHVKGTCRAQIHRSACEWSLGVDTEHSIQTAYINAITAAKHYVYIENQFFITATEEDEDYVLKNLIGQAIVKRIIRAHEEQQKFKVFVVMPLMPAFPADLSTDDAATARLVMHYQYISICRGGRSILEQLEKNGIDPSEYIRFYSLRSWDRMKRSKLEEHLAHEAGFEPAYHTLEEEVEATAIGGDGVPHGKNQDYVTEELYIHAKLMIVDDSYVIMGSANLNDRSQCGDRDSEIALVVEDQDKIPSRMNGEYYEASRFAASLRRHLWKEHLGLLPDLPLDQVDDNMLPLPVPQLDTLGSEEDALVMDPLDDSTLELWNDTAHTNTLAFRNVFHCVPDDTVANWDQYKAFYPDPSKIDIGHVYDPEMSVEEIHQNLDKIRGHLVEFPTQFLKDENLEGESIPFITDLTEELYT